MEPANGKAHDHIDIDASPLLMHIEAFRLDIIAAAYYVNTLRETPWEDAASKDDFVAVHKALQRIVDLINCAGSHVLLIEDRQNDKPV